MGRATAPHGGTLPAGKFEDQAALGLVLWLKNGVRVAAVRSSPVAQGCFVRGGRNGDGAKCAAEVVGGQGGKGTRRRVAVNMEHGARRTDNSLGDEGQEDAFIEDRQEVGGGLQILFCISLVRPCGNDMPLTRFVPRSRKVWEIQGTNGGEQGAMRGIRGVTAMTGSQGRARRAAWEACDAQAPDGISETRFNATTST